MPAAKRIVIDPPEGLLELNEERRRGLVDAKSVSPDYADPDRAMTFDIVTIFPAMIDSRWRRASSGGRSSAGTLDVKVHDLRDFTTDRHRVVDDVPYGGGPGMVLKPEPIFRALDAIAATRGSAG